MNHLKFVRANALACNAFVVFVALVALLLTQVEACPAPSQWLGTQGLEVTVTVNPNPNWQTQHPYCTLSASASGCGVKPTVTISGSNCYPSSGGVDIAEVDVEDTVCGTFESYLVRAVDGIVQVVVIDP